MAISQSNIEELIAKILGSPKSGITSFMSYMNGLANYNRPLFEYLDQRHVGLYITPYITDKLVQGAFQGKDICDEAIAFFIGFYSKADIYVVSIDCTIENFVNMALVAHNDLLIEFENVMVHESIHAFIHKNVQKYEAIHSELFELENYLATDRYLPVNGNIEIPEGMINYYADVIVPYFKKHQQHNSEIIAHTLGEQWIAKCLQNIPYKGTTARDYLFELILRMDDEGVLRNFLKVKYNYPASSEQELKDKEKAKAKALAMLKIMENEKKTRTEDILSRFEVGGEVTMSSEEEKQLLIDVISMNPKNPSYDKYREILKNKYGVEYESIDKDDYYVNNIDLSDIKTKKDFLNFDKFREYGRKITVKRGIADSSQQLDVDNMKEEDLIQAAKDFEYEWKEDSNDSRINWASVSAANSMKTPVPCDMGTYLHELGHILDYKVNYSGLAKEFTNASSWYNVNSGEVFAENFMHFFLSPELLVEKLPHVYDELNLIIPEEWKLKISDLLQRKKRINFEDGGEVTDSSIMFAKSSRIKPKDIIFFDPVITGKNGNKLISYEWSYKWGLGHNEEEGDYDKRISDWGNAEMSGDTGRDVVHKFSVLRTDGVTMVVSSESVPVLLGYIDRKDISNFTTLATAVKTLAKQEMLLSVLEAQEKHYSELQEKFTKAQKPEIIEIDEPDSVWFHDAKENQYTYYSIGDVWTRQDNEYDRDTQKYIKLGYATKETQQYLTSEWISNRIKENGGKWPNELYDLRRRIERQKRKIQELLKKEQTEAEKTFEDGGEIYFYCKDTEYWDFEKEYWHNSMDSVKKMLEKLNQIGFDIIDYNKYGKQIQVSSYSTSTYVTVYEKSDAEMNHYVIRISDHFNNEFSDDNQVLDISKNENGSFEFTNENLNEFIKNVESVKKGIKVFEDGGELSDPDNIFYLKRYAVIVGGDESIDNKYSGYDIATAKSVMNNCDISDLSSSDAYGGGTATLFEYTDEYKFVYELEEDETIEDYPIEDFYEDSSYYELVEEDMGREIDYKEITGENEIEDDGKERNQEVIDQVVKHFAEKYPHSKGGLWFQQSHYFIIPVKNDRTIELRISDHSMNPDNIESNPNIILKKEMVQIGKEPKEIDTSDPNKYTYSKVPDIDWFEYEQITPKNRIGFLSAVIYYEKNETKGAFDSCQFENCDEVSFDTSQNDDVDDIILDIESAINDTIGYNPDAEGDVFEQGGELPENTEPQTSNNSAKLQAEALTKILQKKNNYYPDLIHIPNEIKPALDFLNSYNHTPLFIGGCVRDAFIGLNPKDIDIEVYNIDYAKLNEILSLYGKTNLVGKQFGIIKFKPHRGKMEYDFSIPRKENKIGIEHTDFEVFFDPTMTPQEAALRRDFTFNALAYDPFTCKIHDYFNGLTDLQNKTIRHTSDKFSEDALRILRAMQFQARLDFDIAPETYSLMKSMIQNTNDFQQLSIERISEEWMKWATKGNDHTKIFEFIQKSGLSQVYPELNALTTTVQDHIYHPEGSVAKHTELCLSIIDQLVKENKITGDEKALLVLSVLLHDVGKPDTTEAKEKKGRLTITSEGHEQVGEQIASAFLEKIGIKKEIIGKCERLIANHLAHINYSSVPEKSKFKFVRNLAKRIHPATIQELYYIVTADHKGRLVKDAVNFPDEIKQILELSKEIDVADKKPEYLLMGRHLIDAGLKPSIMFKHILKAAENAQDEQLFSDIEGALLWLKYYLVYGSTIPYIALNEDMQVWMFDFLASEEEYDNALDRIKEAEFTIKIYPIAELPSNAEGLDTERGAKYAIERFIDPDEMLMPIVLMNGELQDGFHRTYARKIAGDKYIAGIELSEFTQYKFEEGGSVGTNSYDEIIHSPEFKSWFGDWETAYSTAGLDFTHPAWKDVSKVVDENGKPLVVYHGTDKQFNIFNIDIVGKSSGAKRTRRGVYFTSKKIVAESFINNYKKDKYGFEIKDGFIYSVFLNLKTPNIIDGGGKNILWFDREIRSIEWNEVKFKDNTEKGFIIYNTIDTIGDLIEYSNIYIVYNPQQIKLADGSNTTFDGSNPDIRFEDGGEVGKSIDDKLKKLGFVFNNSNYRFGIKIDENDYITAFYDKRTELYKIRGVHKFKTPLGENSVGIQFDYQNEDEFFNKISEYLSKRNTTLKDSKPDTFEDGGELIGMGSSRYVYDIGNNKVKKEAYNKKGVLQNKTEVEIANTGKWSILPKIYEYSNDFNWIITDKADFFTEEMTDTYFDGFTFNDIDYYVFKKVKKDNNKLNIISNDPFVSELIKLQKEYDLDLEDLGNRKNYGLIDGKLKIIDFGLTKEGRSKQYEDGGELKSKVTQIKEIIGKYKEQPLISREKLLPLILENTNQSYVRQIENFIDFNPETDTIIKAEYDRMKYAVNDHLKLYSKIGTTDFIREIIKRENLNTSPAEFAKQYGTPVGNTTIIWEMMWGGKLQKSWIPLMNNYEKEIYEYQQQPDPLQPLADAVKEKLALIRTKIGKKVELTEDQKKAQKLKQERDAYISSLPSVNKEILIGLEADIQKALKPFADEIHKNMYESYVKTIDKYIKKDGFFGREILYSIPFWHLIFSTANREEKVIEKNHKGRDIYATYYSKLSKKPDWEAVLNKEVADYVEGLKHNLLSSVFNHFSKLTLPIKSIDTSNIRRGAKGFEAIITFYFENGSLFTMFTQAIGAGGYNIQRFHFRYITEFIGIVLADGTVMNGHHPHYEIVKHFGDTKASTTFEDGGRIPMQTHIEWLKDDARSINKRLDFGFNYVTLYHGTTQKAAKLINDTGFFKDGFFFSSTGKNQYGDDVYSYAKIRAQQVGESGSGAVLTMRVSPDSFHVNTGTSELESDGDLYKWSDGVWRNRQEVKKELELYSSKELAEKYDLDRFTMNLMINRIHYIINIDKITDIADIESEFMNDIDYHLEMYDNQPRKFTNYAKNVLRIDKQTFKKTLDTIKSNGIKMFIKDDENQTFESGGEIKNMSFIDFEKSFVRQGKIYKSKYFEGQIAFNPTKHRFYIVSDLIKDKEQENKGHNWQMPPIDFSESTLKKAIDRIYRKYLYATTFYRANEKKKVVYPVLEYRSIPEEGKKGVFRLWIGKDERTNILIGAVNVLGNPKEPNFTDTGFVIYNTDGSPSIYKRTLHEILNNVIPPIYHYQPDKHDRILYKIIRMYYDFIKYTDEIHTALLLKKIEYLTKKIHKPFEL
jgi:tRNA nucleotidyltransferase (CCA-adding enzyme)